MRTEKTFTVEDLQKAFESGKLYGDGELELYKARKTAFEVWLEDYLNKKTQPLIEQPPYFYVYDIRLDAKYNPNYGDDRICECGHPYYRHFDTYDSMYPCGCKYCQCFEFKEDDGILKKFNFYIVNLNTGVEETESFCTIEATNPDIAEDIFNSQSNELIYTPTDDTFYHIRKVE